MGRVLRVILPLASGRIAHLFVLYGYQGASEDPNILALTNKLLESAICEARVCGTGQPVMFAGDLNVLPALIPEVVKAFEGGRLVDLEAAYAHVTCKFELDNSAGTRRDFFSLPALTLLLALLIVGLLRTAGSAPTSAWLLVSGMVFGLRRLVFPGWYLFLPLLACWRFLTGLGLLLLLYSRIFGLYTWRPCSMFE